MQQPSFLRDLSLPPLEWHHTMRAWSKEMRQEAPVWYDEQLGGWRLFRYNDITRMQNDYQTFSSESATSETGSIIAMDPPRHRQLRSLVTPAFSPRSIARQAPRIEQIARELLSAALAKEQMDMIADFAVPFPILVIADLLGISRENAPRAKEWTDILVSPLSDRPKSTPEARPPLPIAEINEVLSQTIEAHRQQPREDILSLLLEAEVEGQHITPQELFGFFLTLLVAGNITTTQLLGNAMLCFNEYPESWQQLKQDRSLIPGAVEEVLRCLPPNRGTGGGRVIIGGRVTTRDVEISNQLIRKGEEVYVTTISANFDEEHFPEPERFDITRTPNHHISFGHGIHFCLGAPLARLEAKIALELMSEMLPSWHINKDFKVQQLPSQIVFGVQELPITFASA